MRCTIWYHLCNLKNMKNTHGEVLLLEKLQAFRLDFLNCTNSSNLVMCVYDNFAFITKMFLVAPLRQYQAIYCFVQAYPWNA